MRGSWAGAGDLPRTLQREGGLCALVAVRRCEEKSRGWEMAASMRGRGTCSPSAGLWLSGSAQVRLDAACLALSIWRQGTRLLQIGCVFWAFSGALCPVAEPLGPRAQVWESEHSLDALGLGPCPLFTVLVPMPSSKTPRNIHGTLHTPCLPLALLAPKPRVPPGSSLSFTPCINLAPRLANFTLESPSRAPDWGAVLLQRPPLPTAPSSRAARGTLPVTNVSM